MMQPLEILSKSWEVIKSKKWYIIGGLLLVLTVVITTFKVEESISNKKIQAKLKDIERLNIDQSNKQHTIDSLNKELILLQNQEKPIENNIQVTKNHLVTIETKRHEKIDSIITQPIDGTLIILSKRYNKLPKDSISR